MVFSFFIFMFSNYFRANESNTSTSQTNLKQTYEGYTSHQRQNKYETKQDVNSPSTATTTTTSHGENFYLNFEVIVQVFVEKK